MTSQTLAHDIARLALTKKASNVVIMNLKTLSDVTDFFVICSADSDTHVKAVADAINNGMYLKGTKVWRSEGYQNLQWVLLDYVDVVVHVFLKSVRTYYNLEKLWGDAKIEYVVDEASTGAPTMKVKKSAGTRKKK